MAAVLQIILKMTKAKTFVGAVVSIRLPLEKLGFKPWPVINYMPREIAMYRLI